VIYKGFFGLISPAKTDKQIDDLIRQLELARIEAKHKQYIGKMNK